MLPLIALALVSTARHTGSTASLSVSWIPGWLHAGGVCRCPRCNRAPTARQKRAGSAPPRARSCETSHPHCPSPLRVSLPWAAPRARRALCFHNTCQSPRHSSERNPTAKSAPQLCAHPHKWQPRRDRRPSLPAPCAAMSDKGVGGGGGVGAGLMSSHPVHPPRALIMSSSASRCRSGFQWTKWGPVGCWCRLEEEAAMAAAVRAEAERVGW